MTDEIDPIAHLEEAIFRLRNIEDRWHVSDVHRIAVDVRDEILRPALLELQRREVAKALDIMATMEVRQDPGVMPVLQQLGCKVRMANVPEFQRGGVA